MRAWYVHVHVHRTSNAITNLRKTNPASHLVLHLQVCPSVILRKVNFLYGRHNFLFFCFVLLHGYTHSTCTVCGAEGLYYFSRDTYKAVKRGSTHQEGLSIT